MMRFLVRHFIPDYQNTQDIRVRTRYGVLSGIAGIFFNLLLFAGKIVCGVLGNSMSITADAFNNLSDAGSSIITLVGFRLAGHKADSEHPYGHGRIEYLTGLIVSMVIIYVGLELMKSSIEKLLHPETTVYSALSLGILAVSILVKLYMYYYNRSFSRTLNSVALQSTAEDSRNDCIATASVMISAIIEIYSGFHIDAMIGLAVSVYILHSGIQSFRATASPLLGQEPDPALLQKIRLTVMSYPKVLGMHDLMLHDYGPDRRLMSMHVEVPSDMTLVDAHELANEIEKRMSSEFGIETTIHIDPMDTANKELPLLGNRLQRYLSYISPLASYHDLQMVRYNDKTMLTFDVVVPYDISLSDNEIIQTLQDCFKKDDPDIICQITVDHR